MSPEVLRHFLVADPFEPFEIRLSNGDAHAVFDPLSVAVGKNVVAILDRDSDRMAHCTPHHIVSIQKLPSHPQPR